MALNTSRCNHLPPLPFKGLNDLYVCSGDFDCQFEHGERSRTKRRRHVTDGMLWVHCVRDASPNCDCHGLGLWRGRQQDLVLSIYHRTVGGQQLYQPFHIRRQVPRVPARRPTSVVRPPDASCRHRLRWAISSDWSVIVVGVLTYWYEHESINSTILDTRYVASYACPSTAQYRIWQLPLKSPLAIPTRILLGGLKLLLYCQPLRYTPTFDTPSSPNSAISFVFFHSCVNWLIN